MEGEPALEGEPTFVDTNVLVYANQQNATHHLMALQWLARLTAEEAQLWISRQVLREYVAAVTRIQGSEPALSMSVALQRVRYFAARFEVAEDGPDVHEAWLDLLHKIPMGGRQVHDANVAATMLACGITRLVTFNTADFRRFAGRIELLSP